MEQLLNLDKSLFLYLNNEWQHDSLDAVMFAMSGKTFWTPLYLAMIYLIFKEKKEYAWHYVIAVVASIACADQISSSIIKPWVARLRPTHDPSLQALAHIVNDYRGGLYGFVSSHAANAFTLATFLWLSFRERFSWMMFIFLWAMLVSYTRIYLGVHYPLDILGGMIVGALCGYGGYRLQQILTRKFPSNKIAPEE